MKLPNFSKLPDFSRFLKFRSILEVLLFIIFVLYLVFPIGTPDFIAGMVDSPLGMVTLFCVTLFLFLYTNPILGILYIFVAYELLRRSSRTTGRTAYIQYTPTQEKRDANMRAMNPPNETTLEEEVVSTMAPVGHSEPSVFIDSTFKPVAENNHNAFSV